MLYMVELVILILTMVCFVIGPGWGKYFVGPIQFGVCYGAVIACILLGGQSLKVGFL